MKNTMLKFLGIALTAAVSISPVARAQMGQQGMGSQGMGQAQQQQQTPPPAAQTPPATPPPVDPAEEAAYKLASVRTTDGKQIVTASNDFLKKYPNSRYAGLVYAQLAMAYLQQGEGDKAGAAAQKALQINPNSPDALPVMAMVSSHQISGGPGSAQRIQATENYARQGISLLNALQKPADVSDVDFTTQRNEKLAMCHSAMGLAYLNEGKNTLAVQELAEATKLENPPDALDMYLLGVAYDGTNQASQAVTTLEAACPKLQGEMQARCNDFLKEVKKKAPAQPPAPRQ
jgi:Tfp pilus assembly protein PilF